MTPRMLRAPLVASELHAYGVPDRLQAGLMRYLNDRVRPGGFLCAVLRNDLREAVTRADPESMAGLKEIVMFLNMEAPTPSWGDADRVEAWIADKGDS